MVPATAEDHDLPRVGCQQTFADLDRSRLPGPVRSEKAKAFGRANFEIEPIDRHDLAIRLAQ
jgi:hypothetical protein